MGGTCVLLGPLGRGAAGLGSKYPRSSVCLKFGEAKLEIWLNDVEWFVFEDKTPVVVSVRLSTSSTSVVYLWEEKLPLSLHHSVASYCWNTGAFVPHESFQKPADQLGGDPPTPSVLTPEDPEMEDSIGDMAQRYKDTVRSDVIQGPKIEGKVEKEAFIRIWILDSFFFELFLRSYGRYDINRRNFARKCHQRLLGMISQDRVKQDPWPFKKYDDVTINR